MSRGVLIDSQPSFVVCTRSHQGVSETVALCPYLPRLKSSFSSNSFVAFSAYFYVSEETSTERKCRRKKKERKNPDHALMSSGTAVAMTTPPPLFARQIIGVEAS